MDTRQKKQSSCDFGESTEHIKTHFWDYSLSKLQFKWKVTVWFSPLSRSTVGAGTWRFLWSPPGEALIGKLRFIFSVFRCRQTNVSKLFNFNVLWAPSCSLHYCCHRASFSFRGTGSVLLLPRCSCHSWKEHSVIVNARRDTWPGEEPLTQGGAGEVRIEMKHICACLLALWDDSSVLNVCRGQKNNPKFHSMSPCVDAFVSENKHDIC